MSIARGRSVEWPRRTALSAQRFDPRRRLLDSSGFGPRIEIPGLCRVAVGPIRSEAGEDPRIIGFREHEDCLRIAHSGDVLQNDPRRSDVSLLEQQARACDQPRDLRRFVGIGPDLRCAARHRAWILKCLIPHRRFLHGLVLGLLRPRADWLLAHSRSDRCRLRRGRRKSRHERAVVETRQCNLGFQPLGPFALTLQHAAQLGCVPLPGLLEPQDLLARLGRSLGLYLEIAGCFRQIPCKPLGPIALRLLRLAQGSCFALLRLFELRRALGGFGGLSFVCVDLAACDREILCQRFGSVMLLLDRPCSLRGAGFCRLRQPGDLVARFGRQRGLRIEIALCRRQGPLQLAGPIPLLLQGVPQVDLAAIRGLLELGGLIACLVRQGGPIFDIVPRCCQGPFQLVGSIVLLRETLQ